MPSIRANNKIALHFNFAARSFCAHARHAVVLKNELDNFMFHKQPKTRKPFCVRREEIEKIPLRHEGDEFAARGQLREIGNRHDLSVDDGA